MSVTQVTNYYYSFIVSRLVASRVQATDPLHPPQEAHSGPVLARYNESAKNNPERERGCVVTCPTGSKSISFQRCRPEKCLQSVPTQ